ncbi:dihydropteroate synthase [Oceanospirillum beijerinckii]|uniref:dihydropteroate synthase n=1 Tax=Oceanospirillum beijerinckii TaxID=64976 RepID=UPI000411E5EF|nr:dihydropteroate synthase [Oceanospirillum beijerinckii]
MSAQESRPFSFATRTLDLNTPQVMGILNVTPDSFSDGGQHHGLDQALRHAERMLQEGATLIDIGGESTRPGADPVTEQEELERVVPVVEAINARFDAVISVDTSTPAVITEAAKVGAGLINDVRALQREGAVEAAAGTGLPVCLMHMQGQPKDMQQQPSYQDLLAELKQFFTQRVQVCEQAGISADKIILDPGYGFGKTVEHNFSLIKHLPDILAMGYPVLTGTSRKSMLGAVTGREVVDRLPASIISATLCAERGAGIVRVHDVAETVDALKILAAVLEAK